MNIYVNCVKLNSSQKKTSALPLLNVVAAAAITASAFLCDWLGFNGCFVFYFLVNIFLWPFAKLKSHFRMLLYLCSYILQWREIKSGKPASQPACQLNNNRATNQPFTLSQAHYEIQRPGANKMSSSLYPHKIKSKRDTYLGIKLLNLILLKYKKKNTHSNTHRRPSKCWK